MKYYSAIDLHSNNSFLVVIDENNKTLYEKRLLNDLTLIAKELEPYQENIQGIAIESTFNWYWLVDGLKEVGYQVHLVNTCAVKQYSGLKYSDDKHDARWLAHLLMLDILPTGYIYPKKERFVRDLLRKRGQLVQQKTQCILSLKSYYTRHTGESFDTETLRREPMSILFGNEWQRIHLLPTIHLLEVLIAEINSIEKTLLGHIKVNKDFLHLKTIPGIGDILAMTILLEVGSISRFKSVGNFASYCRLVSSKHISNGKTKGKGNVKNGNRYLSWAFHEAAHHALIWNKTVNAFYHKKKKQTNGIIAIRAAAHKIARASFYILRDKVSFDIRLAF
jgi:transposase